MLPPYEVTPSVHVLPAYVPVPGVGHIPINAFLVRGEQPYLVDSGMFPDADAMVASIGALLPFEELRWIYLTHTDPDHIGALHPLLERATNAKLVTTFLAMAKLGLYRAVPPDRIHLLNPNERLRLGDRTLSVLKPPLFDAPETTIFHDDALGALFSSDFCGAPMPTPVRSLDEVTPDAIEGAQLAWSAVDSPWIHDVDRVEFRRSLRELAAWDPEWIFSTHLPPARRKMREFAATLERAPDGERFRGPDQQAFLAMIAQA